MIGWVAGSAQTEVETEFKIKVINKGINLTWSEADIPNEKRMYLPKHMHIFNTVWL